MVSSRMTRKDISAAVWAGACSGLEPVTAEGRPAGERGAEAARITPAPGQQPAPRDEDSAAHAMGYAKTSTGDEVRGRLRDMIRRLSVPRVKGRMPEYPNTSASALGRLVPGELRYTRLTPCSKGGAP